MLSKNRKTLLQYSTMVLVICIYAICAQDTITFNDGMFATGAVKSVTADSVKLAASFTKEVVAVPTERVGAVLLLGERYTFNKEYGVWESKATEGLLDYFTQITLGDDRDVSVLKYRGYPLVRSSKGFSSVMDSIYRTNFYEMRYRGNNVEFSGEVVSTRNILDPSLNKISQSIENPHKSGIGLIVVGFICLGWGGIITSFGILDVVYNDAFFKESFLPFIVVGTGMVTIASISIPIGFKYRKIHNRWEEEYETQDTP